MAMDDLLKEAIADAKAVRETALANAKAALEEAFAPKLQSMLNATLQNEAEVEEAWEAEEESGVEPKEEVGEMHEEIPAKPEGEEEGGVEPTIPAEEEEMGEAFSLESIVKELEEEAAVADSTEVALEEKKEEGEEEEELDEAKKHEEEKEEEEKEEEEEEKEELDEAKKIAKTGHGPGKPVTGSKVVKKLNEEEVEEEVNLEELINELKAEYSEAAATPTLEAELAEVKNSLNEHREVIKFLRSKLNEVNLLNAKLLFTNKLFKNHNMNESQKLRVIETLDRATTLKECKLVYSTLEEAYTGMASAAKKAPAKNIVESIASKPIESTKPSEETVKTVINEGADLAERFKKLAGITK